jgi:hypothetical protein
MWVGWAIRKSVTRTGVGSVAFGGERKQLPEYKCLVSVSEWDVLVWRREFAQDWRAAFGRLLSLFNPTNHASYCIKEFHLRAQNSGTNGGAYRCDFHSIHAINKPEEHGSY